MRVKKRNGRLEDLNFNKINSVVQRACKGLTNASASEIILDAKLQLFDKIPTSEIDKALILTARSKAYKDPDYSKSAARLLLNCVYKEVFKESIDCDTFEQDYKSAFIKNIKKQVKEGRLDPRNLNYDLKKLASAIDIERDSLFTYVAIQNIYDRYLLRKSNDKKIFETPQAFYMRIAMGLCYNEDEPEEMVIKLYNLYSKHRVSPSTPTLFNSATSHNQLSSCYLSEIEDSVDGIFDGLWQEARKSKYAGGLGFHVTKIRAMGAHIKGTNGRSSGLIPWLKIYNDMLIACDQAGKRQGSGCAYLEPWHLDVEDFVDLRKETGEERRRCHDLNTALWCPDLFFERIKNDENWTLFCPSETPDLPDLFGEAFNKRYKEYEEMANNGEIKNFRVISAKSLWKEVLKSLFETSHPWIAHKDNGNMRYSNIHEGSLHGSNLCMEIFLHTKHSEYKDGVKQEIGETAVCNLASIVLPKHVKNGELDKELLAESVELAVTGLNNVIDINFYPTQEAENSNMKHRPIGLGAMGFADLCHMLDVVQDSEEGVKLAGEVAEIISYNAILTSSKLAKKYGKYESYEGSTWSKNIFPIDTYNDLTSWKNDGHIKHEETLDWKPVREHVAKYGMRNSNTMAIAPNACLDSETLIVTDQGIKEIGSFYEKSDEKSKWSKLKVSVLQDDGVRKTSKVYNNGTARVKEITTESGSSISATENHRFKVLKDGKIVWKYVNELNKGDRIIKVIGGHEDLLVSKPLVKMTSRNSEENYDLDNDMAFVIGLYLGSLKYRESHTDIVFHIPKEDHEIKDEAVKIIYNKFTYRPEVEEHEDHFLVKVNSLSTKDIFMYNGIVKNYYNKNYVPKNILESRTSVLCSFIRGLFISNGSINDDGNISFKFSGSENKFAKTLMICLESLGVRCSKTQESLESNIYLNTFDKLSSSIFKLKIAIGDSSKEKSLNIFWRYDARSDFEIKEKNFMLNTVNVVSEIYSNLDEQTQKDIKKFLFNLVKNLGNKIFSFIFNKKEEERNNYMVYNEEIVGIEERICDTFDFEVPQSHLYISSSFISHNSISYQMGCAQSIEPDMKVLFVYENKSGNYYLLNSNFVDDMKKEGIWSEDFAELVRECDGYISTLDIPEKYKEKYKTAFDRDQFKLIEANAERQKWIDMGISFNSWNNKTSLKFLNDLYIYSNELGLKSNYYLRGVAASQVAKSTKKVEPKTDEVEETEEQKAASCSLEAMINGGTCEMCEG